MAGARAPHTDFSPRSIGRILDDAFELYRANFKTIALASAIALFPAGMLLGVSQVFYTRGFLQTMPLLAGGDLAVDEMSRVQLWSLLSNAVSPIFLAARLFVSSMVLAAAPALVAGERPGVRRLLKGGLSRWGWLILISLVGSLITGTAAIALVVPGVWLAMRLALVRVACVVEGAPFDRSFARSWRLTRGFAWRTFVFSVALGIITVTLESAVNSPAVIRQIVASVGNPEALFSELSAGWKTFEGVLTATAASLVYPFAELAWFGYYLDLRARREGMDLVVEARRLAGERA